MTHAFTLRPVVFIFTLALAAFVSSGHAETIVIDHPGAYDLVYMENIDRPAPLSSPMRKVKAHTKLFYVFPGVVIPSIQSVFLLEHSVILPGEEVLDIGTGCGVQAIFAANRAKRVVATDLSVAAVANTQFNAKGQNVSHVVEARYGDLFQPIKPGEKFDVILFNIDYPFDDASQGLWHVHERFFDEVDKYLKPHGRIYYQAGLISNIPRITDMIAKNDLWIMNMTMEFAPVQNREPIVFYITRKSEKTVLKQ